MQSPHSPGFMQHFQKQVHELSDSIAVVWDNRIERFRVYDVSKKGILDVRGRMKYGARLIFTVQESDGSYRPLDNRTLHQIAACVELSHKIWDVPEHRRLETLEKYEANAYRRRQEKLREEIKERIREVAPYLRRKAAGLKGTFYMGTLNLKRKRP